jgi:hypothetical protein
MTLMMDWPKRFRTKEHQQNVFSSQLRTSLLNFLLWIIATKVSSAYEFGLFTHDFEYPWH